MRPAPELASHPRLLAVSPANPAFAILAADLLREGCAIRFRADGRSMHPFLRAGDLLTVRPLTDFPVRRGDILLYRISGAGVVAHRVVARPATAVNPPIAMRGDASCGLPDLVRVEDVLGRVVSCQRGDARHRLDSRLSRALGLLWVLRQNLRQAVRRALVRTR